MRKREQKSGSSILATECGAFLDGTLAEYWDERGVVVPVWAWTNLLAHGSEELIAESVVRPSRPRRAARSWRIARSYLAYQMLDLTDARCTLADLQRNVLMPLELDMAARPETGRWSPGSGSRRWTGRSATSIPLWSSSAAARRRLVGGGGTNAVVTTSRRGAPSVRPPSPARGGEGFRSGARGRGTP